MAKKYSYDVEFVDSEDPFYVETFIVRASDSDEAKRKVRAEFRKVKKEKHLKTPLPKITSARRSDIQDRAFYDVD